MTTSTILLINTGTSANSGDGDTLRTAFNKINYNFSLVEDQLTSLGYNTATGSIANLGDLAIIGATISTTGTDEGIVLSPNGTGTVTVLPLLNARSGVRYNDGTIQTSAVPSLTVAQVTTGTYTTYSNTVTNVSRIVFDTEAGFTVDQFGQSTAFISMNSTFKYWEVDGQATLIANGLDTMHFIAGPGIKIITSSTNHPQSIEFDVKIATTASLGGIIVGAGLSIDTATGVLSATGGAGIGNLLFDNNTMYPNSSTNSVTVASQDGQNGNYVLLPANSNSIDPLVIYGQNGVLVTTPTSSTAPIVISPNNYTNGPGDVQIYARGDYPYTAGVYMASSSSQIFLYPDNVLPYLVGQSTGVPVGTVDIATIGGDSISLRPGGLSNTTGTVYINGSLVVDTITINTGVISGNKTLAPGAGGVAVNGSNYQTSAITLDTTAYIQKLASGAYYLPPGIEGQQMYFVPVDGAISGTNIAVWMQNIRIFFPTATVSTNRGWTPFVNEVMSSALYTDGAWNLSTNNIL